MATPLLMVLLVLQVLLALLFLALLVGGLLWVLWCSSLSNGDPELRWDWARLDREPAEFPRGFLWGVAAAAHQVEGGNDNNNWSDWERRLDGRGRPRIRGGHVSGEACDHWSRYRQDMALIADLGVKSYRFSIEWSRVEPRSGQWDEEAIGHYHDVIAACREHGLEPMVTLLHFTHPRWFEARGAFEREENIAAFESFCRRIFEEYGDKVKLWCTVNEPEVVPIMGYVAGIFPPGLHSLARCARVMRNLVLAHARVVRILKDMPAGQGASIGLVKNVFQFDPYHRWSPLDWAAARLADRVYNAVILDYLHTGVFTLRIPGLVWYTAHDPEVKGSGDYIGLNYYSHMALVVQPDLKAPITWRPRPGEVATDMPYPTYPEGFYRALHRIARLEKPIYVTENGIADARDDRREVFIQRYLKALSLALKDGLDIRGYYYWSFVDNFEWAEGWHMKFGLYELDRETMERRLRKGAAPFVDAVRSTTEGEAR